MKIFGGKKCIFMQIGTFSFEFFSPSCMHEFFIVCACMNTVYSGMQLNVTYRHVNCMTKCSCSITVV
jgi:hypothetical protein